MALMHFFHLLWRKQNLHLLWRKHNLNLEQCYDQWLVLITNRNLMMEILALNVLGSCIVILTYYLVVGIVLPSMG
jgi:hypothetical protein